MTGSPTTLAPARIPAGTQLNGIYQIDHLIASGGMGEVYKGHAIETGDPVAIKVMLPDLAANESALALFRKEASALHYLYHEGIVRYYVFTVEPRLQCPYLAMEFVEGEQLSEMLQRSPLSFDAILILMRRMASALDAAHERQIIHRDVSPDNIIVPGGQVSRAKIIDFGIARSTQTGAQTIIGGGFAGKYNYVSPEQLGLFGGDVTGKSDIYSLGLVLVEALTGTPINMSGSQFEVIEKRRAVPDLSHVDVRLRPLITKMLQPDPADRPASMAEVAAWQPAPSKADTKPAAPPKYSLHEGRARSAEGKERKSSIGSIAAIAAGVAIVLLGGGGAAYYFLSADSVIEAPPPRIETPTQRPTPPQQPTPNTPTFPPTPQITPETPKSERVAEIERFIEKYDGGDCFFITTVAVTEQSARILGYGASLAPFQILDDAFRRVNGFEADIGLWQTTPAQCAAVNFLNKMRGGRATLPRFQAAGSEAKGGEQVIGTVSEFVGRPLSLLMVDDAGNVSNVTGALGRRRQGPPCTGACPLVEQEEIEFRLRMDPVAVGPRPRLVIAISSNGNLEALRGEINERADTFFEKLMTEATGRNQTLTAAAKYINVNR